MVAKLYTDDELTSLREMPKEVTNPRARWTEKPKSNPSHYQRTFLDYNLSVIEVSRDTQLEMFK